MILHAVYHSLIWNPLQHKTTRQWCAAYSAPAPLVRRTRLVLALAIVCDRTQPIPHSRGVRPYMTLQSSHCGTVTTIYGKTWRHSQNRSTRYNTHLTVFCPSKQHGNTNLNFTEARDSGWQWYNLNHMQICTSLQTDNHASTAPLSFFYRSDALPASKPTASKHWKHILQFLLPVPPKTLVRFGRVVLEMCVPTNRQTDTQFHHKSSAPLSEQSKTDVNNSAEDRDQRDIVTANKQLVHVTRQYSLVLTLHFILHLAGPTHIHRQSV